MIHVADMTICLAIQDVDIRKVYHEARIRQKRKDSSASKANTMIQSAPVLSPIPKLRLGPEKTRTIIGSNRQNSVLRHVAQASNRDNQVHILDSSRRTPASAGTQTRKSLVSPTSVTSPKMAHLGANHQQALLVSPLGKASGFASATNGSQQLRPLEANLPQRSDESDWEYMNRLDSELYRVEQEQAVVAKHMKKQKYYRDLKSQLAQPGKRAGATDPMNNNEYRHQAQAEAQAYAAEQKKLAQARQLRAIQLKKEMNVVLQAAEKKQIEREARRVADAEEMAKIAKTAALEEAMDLKLKKARQQQFKEETTQANAAAIRSKKEAQRREAAAEQRLLEQSEKAAQEREARRLAAVRQRKADIEAKLNMMSSVFKEQDEVAKLAAERAEAQAAERERKLQLREQIEEQKKLESEKVRAEVVRRQVQQNREKRQKARSDEEAMLREAFKADRRVQLEHEQAKQRHREQQRKQLHIYQAQEQERQQLLRDAQHEADPGVVRGNQKIIEAKLCQLASLQKKLHATKKAAFSRPRFLKQSARGQSTGQPAAEGSSVLSQSQQEFVDRLEERIAKFASPHK